MTHDMRMLCIACGYLTILAVAAAWLWRQRRTQLSLRWADATTQRQMEQYGTRVLNRMGWGTRLYQSHATRSVYRCEKQDDILLIVFLREQAFFARLLALLRVHSAFNLRRTTIVLFNAPREPMLRLAREIGVSVIHYTELRNIEEIQKASLTTVAAPRAAAGPVPLYPSASTAGA